MAQAIIMAGGQGERFWPLTHPRFPKYRIRFDGKKSLLQKTYARLLRLYDKKNIHVVTTQDHLRIIQKELPSLPRTNILIEPFRRNTAAAITFSCALLANRLGPGEIVTFFPADHLIRNEAAFQKTIRAAIQLAKQKPVLVTIGIKPHFPCTGYGYIQSGERIPANPSAFRVKAFKEKPSRKKAQAYLRANTFYWNGGIFTWRISVYMGSMKKYSPTFHAFFEEGISRKNYSRLPRLSIDHALLEKADNMAIVKTDMDWCDMGSWDMFLEKAKVDRNKNCVVGNSPNKESSDVLLFNTRKNAPLIAFGVSGLIAVQTDQGTLICKRERSEEAAVLLKRE